MFDLGINDLDKKIWDEELNDFVPEKVYDIHTHIYQWQSNLDKNKSRDSIRFYFYLVRIYPFIFKV